METVQKNIEKVNELISTSNIVESMLNLVNAFSNKIVFSTSFSNEDQLISHLIFSNQISISVFTLDTGRLFAETYSTWARTTELYQQKITAFYPAESLLQNFITEKGPNSFYESVENRKQCCYLRKVEPLQRALKDKTIWITGIRAEHSNGRNDMPLIEYDNVNKIIKYHPLLHWTSQDVNDFIKANNIPNNPLTNKGFVSIGCQPCTRAIQPGDNFRAGRWWWEDNNKKECGLHTHNLLNSK